MHLDLRRRRHYYQRNFWYDWNHLENSAPKMKRNNVNKECVKCVKGG